MSKTVYVADHDDTMKYNLYGAVVLNNFRYWLRKNLANNHNIRDGRVWTYNSMQALSKLFPFLTYEQVRYQIKKLKDAGILLTADYNENPYDNTTWYTINEVEFLTNPGGENHNSTCENSQPYNSENSQSYGCENSQPYKGTVDTPNDNQIRGKLMKDYEVTEDSYQHVQTASRIYKGFRDAFPDNLFLKQIKMNEWIPPVEKLINLHGYEPDTVLRVAEHAATPTINGKKNFWYGKAMTTQDLYKNFDKIYYALKENS